MGERVITAKERSLDGACKNFLQALCAKYDNLPEVKFVILFVVICLVVFLYVAQKALF